MTSDPGWLTAACGQLLQTPAGPARTKQALGMGARAADDSYELQDLVSEVMHAAARHWSGVAGEAGETAAGVHARAGDLLATIAEVLDAAISGFHERLRSELSHQDTQRAEFVNDLLTGRADPGHLAERAQRYGIRFSGSHVVTVATSPAMTETIVGRIDSLLAARYGSANTLTTWRDSQLVCISTGGLRGLPAELAHHLLAHLGAGIWQVGVGRTHPGLDGIAKSLGEARNTLELAAKLGFTAPVLHAADLLVFPVLLRDRDAITDLVTTVLGPLLQARGGAQSYLDTLTVLFDNQGNYTATARQLHLSVRAVTYRLDRIQALTGYHPSEPTQRFTLHTAVLGARLLGWPAAQ